jgi:hypothetical protein
VLNRKEYNGRMLSLSRVASNFPKSALVSELVLRDMEIERLNKLLGELNGEEECEASEETNKLQGGVEESSSE